LTRFDWFQRARTAFVAARDWASRPSNKRWLLLIAFAIFAVLAFISFRNLPEGVELRPLFMVAIVLIGAPATYLLNAFEYRSIAKAAGHRVTLGTALQVSMAASLANLLPAPGAVAVRTAALKLEGSSIGSALSVNAIAGIIWIGATALVVGIALLADPDSAGGGAVVATAGAAILVGGALALRRRLHDWRRVFVELLVIETGTTLAAAFQFALAFAAIGQSVSIGAAITIASAQVLAAAIGVFPAGLGVREALAAGLAVSVQVPAAVAVAASAIERACSLIGWTVYLPALGLYLRNSAGPSIAGEDESTATPAEVEAHAAALGAAAPPTSRTTKDSDRAGQ
jgi:uncharacterized membrane protein YbhN (UPF0104 family)